MQVGAASLDARLDCEAFASAHRATSHYDRSSFVGLAWRPPNKAICCEVYSTGRANLPGSVTERALQSSWRDMLPELLQYSTGRSQLRLFPEMQHLLGSTVAADEDATARNAVMTGWDDWAPTDNEARSVEGLAGNDDEEEDIDDAMLGALGL